MAMAHGEFFVKKVFRKLKRVFLSADLASTSSLHGTLVILLAFSVCVNALLVMLQGDDSVSEVLDENCEEDWKTWCRWKYCEGEIEDSMDTRKVKVIFRGDNGFKVTNKDALLAGADTNRKAFLTIGLPTFERKTRNYFFLTLDSLLRNASKSVDNYIKIVILLAHTNTTILQRHLEKLQNKYGQYLKQGDIQVIRMPAKAYPQLRGLRRTLGDSTERMYWRSKQAVDYAFLMQYCQHLSPYYLHLEDDVIAIRNYNVHIETFMKEMEGSYWFNLDFNNQGFIGKLYRSETMALQAKLIRMFYSEMPVDLMMLEYRKMFGNNMTKNTYKMNIFQHIGYESSSFG